MESKSSAKKPEVFALVDCDNFFVSCERAFRPDLWEKPVAVLSNNDGCIVARSNEVKRMGVPMGIPYFKIKDQLAKRNVTLFSGNFSLYGDFSQRVVGMLEEASPRVEVYSVDESFLEVSSLNITDYEAWAQALHQKVWQWLGIPVSIGIAPTKTLAKAAAEHAKKTPGLNGAYSLMPDAVRDVKTAELRRMALLKDMPVQSVWGVGWRTAPQLANRGVKNAYDLSQVSDEWARRQFTIRGLNTVRELRGVACLPLEGTPEPQKSMAVTRTFATRLHTYYELEGRIASFAAKAAQKLRKAGQIAPGVGVFIAGDRHRDGDRYRRVSTIVPLVQPSSDTAVILKAALQALSTLYDPEFTYRRGGVVLFDLASEDSQQLSWLSSQKPEDLDGRRNLMQAIDEINNKYHTRLVRHAAEPLQARLRQADHLSRSYTTSWQDIPRVVVN